ncbi:hypothetical protein [Allonocardiopsis opalescens]|uniref:Head-to-tail adaptor n=1 Tax=Allonocardiopsis opalescens TaxID=1144618 RepID=A0A2T0PSU8_9ACTN|nr:hypothetical protein [Allonocardiopsis opalescens]PRX91981.1 hypothetical protein CLV72_11254 [Allonocardiopsis opalescens]
MRVYATVEEFTAWLAPDPAPANAARLLRQASGRVDELLIGACYDTDTAGMPTAAPIVEALRDATCAQAEFTAAWVASGGDSTGARRRPTAVTVGQVSYTYGGRSSSGSTGSGAAAADRVPDAPEAVTILRLAGLLPVTPITY